MKVKHVLAVFLISFVFTAIGVWAKLIHQPFSSILLTIGVVVRVIAILMAVVKLLTLKRFREFLDG